MCLQCYSHTFTGLAANQINLEMTMCAPVKSIIVTKGQLDLIFSCLRLLDVQCVHCYIAACSHYTGFYVNPQFVYSEI